VHIGATPSCSIKLKEPAAVPGRGHFRLSAFVIFLFKKEFIMAKSDFIPSADNDFSVWLDRFTSNLSARIADFNLLESDLAPLKNDVTAFHNKIAAASDAAAAAKHATADKNDSRRNVESSIRSLVRRIKAHPGYSTGQGDHLGIEGPNSTVDLATLKPSLSGVDQTGGQVALSFSKFKSDGVNIYCQREGDADWILLARATFSPYLDNRPLLTTGKPELRRYSAVYMLKDKEIGQFSDDLVINCAP
jgi:hypothetical protein